MEKTKKLALRVCLIALAIILAVIGVIVGVNVSNNVAPSTPSNAGVEVKNEIVTEPEYDYDAETTYAMPKMMSFTSRSLATALAANQTVDVRVKAYVTPYDAANTAVDYSIAWGNAPTHGAEPVTDYVTVTPDSDGSLSATVSCKKAFGNDRIIVTVTTRDGGFTDECTVTFVGVASSLAVTNSTINPIADAKRGTYYQLGTNKTYNFDINLDNVFHTVGSKNLTVSVGGSGALYFGKTYVDGSTGMTAFSEMTKRNMSDMVDRFITSATISGNTLTVKTGSKVVENYYSSTESDEYFTGSYTYDRYVFYDEYGTTYGQYTADDYEGKANSNVAALPSCYFTITVTDTVSGLSETFRVWLATSVSGVYFDDSSVTI